MRSAIVRTALGSVALVLVASGPAQAYHGDRISRARHAVVGFTAKNYRTHVWTTIIGTYRYSRIVHHHRVAFRGITVSAQRCKKSGCFGRAKEGRLWSPLQHGVRPRTSKGAGPQAGAVGNFCLSPAGVHCAAPWNWAINDPVNKALTSVRKNLAQPCAAGGLAGYGVKVSEGAAGEILAEEGTLTVAERAAGVFGPEGFAVGTLAGCFVGIGVHGWSSIRHIASSLNPFDRSSRWEPAHRSPLR